MLILRKFYRRVFNKQITVYSI